MINNAKIATTQKAFADDMSAMATKVEEIRAEIGDEIKASITEETTARVEADKAISKRITALQSQLDDDIKAAIATEQETRATADESLARQITTLKAQTGEDIKAAIGAESSARTDADSALSSQINSLAAQTSEDIKAAITSEATARADADGALGKRVDTIKAEVDGNSAIIQEQAKAIADTNEKVSTAWTLKMETSTSGGQKYVAGIALGIDSTGLSQFLVQADRFGLVNSVNGHITTPFVIENGVAYMNGAWIKNGTIDNAKIGQVIQSDNYAGSSAGWSINKNGNAEFNQVTVRGTVYANQGVFRGRIEAQEGYFNGTVYAEKIEGDVAKAVVLGFNSSIGIPAASYDRHLVIPYIGVHGWTYSGGYGQGGGTVWVDSSYGGRIASVSSTAMHGGGSAYLFLPRNVSTTLSYGGQLDHANAVGTLTVLLFKA